MKFARYLDNAQAPEWKRAYIDYRGLKKRIMLIKSAQQSGNDQHLTGTVSSDSEHESLPSGSGASKWADVFTRRGNAGGRRAADTQDERQKQEPEAAMEQIELDDVKTRGDDVPNTDSTTDDNDTPATKQHTGVVILDFIPYSPRSGRPSAARRGSQLLDKLRRRSSRFIRSSTLPIPSPTLSLLLDRMPRAQLAFMDKLDSELSKVESFFVQRVTESRARSLRLKEQLGELKDHRRLFHDACPGAHHNTPLPFLPVHRLNSFLGKNYDPHWSRDTVRSDERVRAENRKADAAQEVRLQRQASGAKLLPEDYISARKKLKRAVAEHYSGLEVLNNYRILNITGFRKALKKFEKVTGVPVQDVYMKEKVDVCSFASDQTVQELLKETEDHFTTRFAQGDRKRALASLRASPSQKTHHFSTFRTGIALGLAFPAFVDGIVRSYQDRTRAAIPAWGSLLYIYAIFLVPTLFAFLVGVNLLVWSTSRINYVFIFEFDVRTRLDHREYFEIPCIILTALCFSFWLSFVRAMEDTVEPWTWPVIWLVFVTLFMINPLPIMSRESRWWTLRKMGRILTSGFHRVDFAEFWLGDQLCSLAFSLSGIYFVGCSYVVGFHSDQFERCSQATPWGIPFILASLPLFARFLQSLRRWSDSRLNSHLINGGKYFVGILYYLLYYTWRHHDSRHDSSFVAFCFFGIINSLYSLSWDLLVDWSVLRPHARFFFLRDELIYSNWISLYYLSIITNIIIRFMWIIYLPESGPITPIRSFIVALLEVLRRCQWNSYRLESEHIGNMDQYRVTREVPLPYSIDELAESDGGDDDERTLIQSGRSSKSRSN